MIREKKLVIYTMILLITVFACGKKNGNVVVEGEINEFDGNLIEFKLLTSDDAVLMDSAVIGEDKTFKLYGQVEIPQFAALDFNNGDVIYLIIKPKDHITLEADGKDILNTYTIDGSSDSYKIKQLLTNHQKTLDKIADVIISYRNSLEMNGSEAERLLAERDGIREKLIEEHREYTKKFIQDNINSMASLMALYQAIGRNSYVLDISKHFKYFSMVDSSLMMKYPTSDAVKDLNRMVVAYKEQNANVSIGQAAPDISLPNPDGDTIQLSSLKGKYVLLDFWASWCPPCREENPVLVEAYKKFSNEGFEIYQVSLDKTKDAWLKGIEEDQLSWTHVSDLQFWNSSAAKRYSVREIPSNFLINPDGIIVARNLRGQDLENKLSEVLN